MRNVKRFLTCRRGAVALESAIAATVLVAALAGVYEIVHATLTRDFLARGGYQMANANALHDTSSGTLEEMRQRLLDAFNAEVGDWLSFELADQSGECADPVEDGEKPKSWCLAISLEVYDNPTALKNGQKKDGTTDGGHGDLVVVRLTLKPRGLILGSVYNATFGQDGLRVTAVVRNERIEEEA